MNLYDFVIQMSCDSEKFSHTLTKQGMIVCQWLRL